MRAAVADLWLPARPAAWYAADALLGAGVALPADGSAVATWRDLSGRGRDVTQATSSARPLFRSASPNLLDYSRAACCDASLWPLAGAVGGAAGTLATTTAWRNTGDTALRITATAGDGTGYLYYGSAAGKIPVDPAGGTVTVFGTFHSPATVGARAQVFLNTFTNPAGTAGGAQVAGASVALPTNGTDLAFVRQYTYPAGVYWLDPRVILYNVKAGELYDFDSLGVMVGSVSTWTPPAPLIGGLPGVQFDGFGTYLSTGASLLTDPGFTSYVVFKATGTRSVAHLWSLASGARYRTIDLYTQAGGAAGSIPQDAVTLDFSSSAFRTGLTVGAGHIVTGIYPNGSPAYLDGYVDGVQAGLGSPDYYPFAPPFSLRIGLGTIPDALISELLLFEGVHDAATIRRVQKQLGAKYGVAVA